jgi:hypothetical protein
MLGTGYRMRCCGGVLLTASLLLVPLLGGCSAIGLSPPSAAPANSSPSSSGSLSDRISSFFSGSSAKAPQTVANAQPDVNCPSVEVRQGASTLTIGPADDKSAMLVKYQGEFAREARECAVVGGNMVMRIGVEGHVIVGPAGGPGQVEVPLRIAVVQETPGGTRPIATKFIRIPVTVDANRDNAVFTHIEEGLSFPLPTPTSLLDDYIAYVGFDPLAAEPQEKQKPKPRPKPQPKPASSAN